MSGHYDSQIARYTKTRLKQEMRREMPYYRQPIRSDAVVTCGAIIFGGILAVAILAELSGGMGK